MSELVTETRRAKLADLRLLKINARYMPHEQFATLVANIRRDGRLTSVPLAAKDPDGGYTVLSGNHRVMAARDAGIVEADVMFIDEVLDVDQRLALQLSHNAISGEDDPAVLKALYEQVDDPEWRTYSGLDDATLDLIDKVDVATLSEANLDFQTVTLTFLPDEAEQVKATFEAARQLVMGSAWLASMADYDRTLDALAAAGGANNITNQALALRLLLTLAENHFDDLVAAWWDEQTGEPRHPKWVPVAAVVGTDRIPAAAAGVIRQAVDRAMSRQQITEPWQILEFACADWLAGP